MNSEKTVQESSDLQGQRAIRLNKAQKLRELGINPYPSESKKDSSNKKIVDNYSLYENKEVHLSGRVFSLRKHGKLMFIDLVDASGKIQLYIRSDVLESTDAKRQIIGWKDIDLLDAGDFLQAFGEVTKTQRGEISLLVKNIKILTKSLRPLPTSLTDKEDRYRRRYLDMAMNPEIRERFIRRSKFWDSIRKFLNDNEFVEINIPVLEHVTGGADARPFVTHYDALNEDFYLRISHELPLKRLLGGGFEKVYDIGPRFRNEGFSDEHLPEHIAMEWYWAYGDYREGMDFTKELFRQVMKSVYGTLKFKIKEQDVDLSKDWEEIKFADIIGEKFGIDIFADSIEDMNRILLKNGVDLGKDINKNRVVDNLWKLIRKDITGPAFLIDVPKFLSPLSKVSKNDPKVTMRFHPIIAGSEMANAFSELNDPIDQLERFVEQQKLRDAGDDEAHMLDIDFIEMLEYGMPPAVGFGLSERVFWLFESTAAKEGVPFPQLKFDIDNVTKSIYKDNLQYFDKEE